MASVSHDHKGPLYKVDVHIGGTLVHRVVILEQVLDRGELLLSYIRRITDHDVKTQVLTLLIQDLWELKSPLKSIVVDGIVLYLLDVTAELIDAAL